MKAIICTMKIRFTSPFIYWPTLVLVSIGLGIGAGFLLHGIFKKPIEVVITDREHYLADMDVIMSHYESVRSSSKDYTELEPYEAVNVAYRLFENTSKTRSVGVGKVNSLGMKQDIFTTTVHIDNRYMEESISKGIINIYDRMYEEGDTTTRYWGNKSDYTQDSPSTLSNEAYEQLMGRRVSRSLIYIVSSKTMSNNDLSGLGLSKIAKNDKGYKVDVELNPITGVIDYQKQMQNISELAAAPSFEYCHLSIQTDNELNLLYSQADERYHAAPTKPIQMPPVKCTANLVTVFRTESDEEISMIEYSDPVIDYPSSQQALLERYGLN